MIKKENLEEMLKYIGYVTAGRSKVYEKKYTQFDCVIQVDFSGSGSITYPEEKGMKITRKTTCNFSDPENFVVLECITRLMDKGYRPEHIELEREWTLGHEKKSGFADILVKDEDGKTLFIIECKTDGGEYKKEYNNTINDGGQIFSYWQQERSCKWLVLYASDFDGSKVTYTTESVDCSDDANILASAKKDSSIHLYKDAHTVEELYTAWDETYEKRFCGDVIFRDDSQAYKIGVKPLRKVDLMDFSQNDKIVNKFEEILRHNNVSDKENAFNRLIALFICKLVDEIQKGKQDIVDFQYKVGSDTYESLQDRLQRLHKEGMEKFMREEIFYVSDDYAENLVQQYTGQKRQKMIEDLKGTLRILKFYTNNDFAFKDVHNEELFYQNGKILVEVVQLFENYRIIGSNDVQMLGDLFEQLLNKGFKQNEGQFFTPIPITRFIWDSLPVERLIKRGNGIEFPRIVDYACGAGHFLTQGFEAVNDAILNIDPSYNIDNTWAEKNIFGIEKDYRLARVSKISLFMHGAGDGNVIFGDGLENYADKGITPYSFDILVANPPYSVKAFKPHLKLKTNTFEILDKISNDGSEIETLFVERIAQLVKPKGIAAVILPNSILTKENESYVAARESLLKNFLIRAVVQMGRKTFGATGTNTVILFLEKYNEPPKRLDLITDSVASIFESNDLNDWEDNDILIGYLSKIDVDNTTYAAFVNCEKDYSAWQNDPYFGMYYESFIQSPEYQNKIKQKSFDRLSNEQKLAWFNEHFYETVFAIEKEKLTYYALVYNQTTLIIVAPTDNKEQENFLGYKWSDRKGQEGIQIITPGGKLYNSSDRYAEGTSAALVRNSFYEEKSDAEDIQDIFYYLHLHDMIDFSKSQFNKAIRTSKVRVKRPKEGFQVYKLSSKDDFELSIGKRLLQDEISKDSSKGIPVYSANVKQVFGYVEKGIIKDFSSMSVLWGIDGDWMVNCIEKDQEFCPTDHCGVLRVKNKSILPKYVALALEVEGRYEGFSRSYRSSTQRVKDLSILVPSTEAQEKVIQQFKNIDDSIDAVKGDIEQFSTDVKNKFIELFGDIYSNPKNYPLKSLGQYCCILNPSKPTTFSINDDELVSFVQMPSVSEDGFVDSSVTKELSEVKTGYTYFEDGDVIFAKITPCMENGKGGIALDLNNGIGFGSTEFHILRPIPNTTDSYWLYYATSFEEFRIDAATNMTGSSGHRRVPEDFLNKFMIGCPPYKLQLEFAKYVKSKETKIRKEFTKYQALLNEREVLLKEYFD